MNRIFHFHVCSLVCKNKMLFFVFAILSESMKVAAGARNKNLRWWESILRKIWLRWTGPRKPPINLKWSKYNRKLYVMGNEIWSFCQRVWFNKNFKFDVNLILFDEILIQIQSIDKKRWEVFRTEEDGWYFRLNSGLGLNGLDYWCFKEGKLTRQLSNRSVKGEMNGPTINTSRG